MTNDPSDSEKEIEALLLSAQSSSEDTWNESALYLDLEQRYLKTGLSERAREMRWESILASLEGETPGKESAPYFQRRILEAASDHLKARYGIHLWGLNHVNADALVAQDALKRLISKYSGKKWWSDFKGHRLLPDFFSQLLSLTAQRGDQETLGWLEENISRIVKDLEEEKATAHLCRVLEKSIPNVRHLQKAFLLNLIDVLRNCANEYGSDSGGADSKRRILTTIKDIQKEIKEPLNAQQTQREIFKSYEAEGDWWMENGGQNRGIGAVAAYQNALRFTEILALKKDSPEVQNLARKLTAASEQINYHSFELRTQINADELLRPILSHFGQHTGVQILDELARDPGLDPSIEKAQHDLAAQRAEGIGVFRQFVPEQRIVRNRPLGAIQPGPEMELHELNGQLLFQLQTIGINLEMLLSRLFADKRVTVVDFIDRISSQDIMEKSHLPIIQDALEQVFTHRNFIAGISELVPQIEHYFRRVIALVGGATQKRNSEGNLQEISIGELIYSPIIRAPFGDSIIKGFDLFLNSERYVGLRHQLAHGLMAAEEYTSTKAFIGIWLVLKLTALKRKEPPDGIRPAPEEVPPIS